VIKDPARERRTQQEAGDSGGREGGGRGDGIGPEELGLTLAGGKTVLKQVQEGIVQIQIEAISAAAKACRNCGRNQRMKDLAARGVSPDA
jgi:hypothetical protein